ncbi:MAG: energy transducer TonB [Spirochaetes bacterium]|nr:energy transducer TonB [Spirochaetota bacterium]
MIRAIKQNRKRMLVSLILALSLHGVTFVSIQYFLPLKAEEIPEYSGPIEVTISRAEKPLTLEDEGRRVEKTAISEAERHEEPVRSVPAIKDTMTEPLKEPVQFFRPVRPVESEQPVKFSEDVEEDISEGITREEMLREELLAPADRDEVLMPVQQKPVREEEEEKPEKVLPFEPSSEIEPGPLAFDLDRLDEAIQKGKETPATADEKGSAVEQGLTETDISSSETPLIVWDDASGDRTLIYKGPPPDIPTWVKEEGLDLKMAVTFAVTPEGLTTSVEIEESSGYSDVDTSVLEAVRKMKFNPVADSKIVTGTIRYIISPR